MLKTCLTIKNRLMEWLNWSTFIKLEICPKSSTCSWTKCMVTSDWDFLMIQLKM